MRWKKRRAGRQLGWTLVFDDEWEGSICLTPEKAARARRACARAAHSASACRWITPAGNGAESPAPIRLGDLQPRARRQAQLQFSLQTASTFVYRRWSAMIGIAVSRNIRPSGMRCRHGWALL